MGDKPKSETLILSTGCPADYAAVLADLKNRIARERFRVVMAANASMTLLYWDIGNIILHRQKSEGWGAKIVDRLSADLRSAFPEMRGLSPRNLKYMRAFAEAWPKKAIVQQVAAQIPWAHQMILLDKVENPEQRIWYARRSAAEGWSRAILVLQIENRLIERQSKALTNFPRTLPPAESDLAGQGAGMMDPRSVCSSAKIRTD